MQTEQEMLDAYMAKDPRDLLGPGFRKFCDERGIVPENHSLGFSEKEQKWYGWSHRGVCGFGIGSTVKPGDCAYTPTDPADFLSEMVTFWGGDDYHESTWAEHGERDGEKGVLIFWRYNDKAPNKSLHGTTGGSFARYPTEWGRGTWTAATLDDAKQMAMDYAESVS